MTAIIKNTEHLESTLGLGAGSSFPVLDQDPDVIEQLLNDTRSESTRRAYLFRREGSRCNGTPFSGEMNRRLKTKSPQGLYEAQQSNPWGI